MHLLTTNKKLIPSLVIPKPLVFASKIIETASKGLAARLAARLFVTPINFATPKREEYMLKSAQKKRLAVPEINKEIEILSYGYSKKKVLLAHGWAGRSTQLFAFADRLLEKGYMVISFDGPAHGMSTGKTTSMLEFLTTLKKIDEVYGPFESAIGHSFGGMSLYNANASFLSLKSFVTIGAGDKVTDIIKRFASNLSLKPKSAIKIQKRLEKKWQTQAEGFASHYVARNITIPVLTIHDSEDGDVPVSSAYNIRQNLEKGSLLISHGLGHTKILRNKEIVNKSIDFIIANS
ncbi:MAG: alpha/beta hydrolase [Flavobacteriaceae bacterium]